MESLARTAFLGTSAVMLVLGFRLLGVSWRTRQIPEMVIGLAYSLGIVGLFVLIASSAKSRAGEEVFTMWLTGHSVLQLAQVSMIVGVWRIFRPADRWAFGLVLMGLGLCALSIINGALQGDVHAYSKLGFHLLLTTGIGCLSYGWTTFESIRYADQMNRRRVLGMATTLDVWRFRCWGIGGCCATLVSIVSLLSVLVYGKALSQVPEVFLFTQFLLVISSTSTWFAFFPPDFYRQRAFARDPEPAG